MLQRTALCRLHDSKVQSNFERVALAPLYFINPAYLKAKFGKNTAQVCSHNTLNDPFHKQRRRAQKSATLFQKNLSRVKQKLSPNTADALGQKISFKPFFMSKCDYDLIQSALQNLHHFRSSVST